MLKEVRPRENMVGVNMVLAKYPYICPRYAERLLGATQVGLFDDGARVLVSDARRTTLGFSSTHATKRLAL